MSLWTLCKIIAALCVMAIMAFTAMLAYHVAVEPLGGVFSKVTQGMAIRLAASPTTEN